MTFSLVIVNDCWFVEVPTYLIFQVIIIMPLHFRILFWKPEYHLKEIVIFVIYTLLFCILIDLV